MKEVRLDQRSRKWHLWRESGITATDSVVILGKHPSKTPLELWKEKLGLTKPADLSVIPAVKFGVEHEDYARSLWEWKHTDIAPAVCGEYDANPIFRASFDGLTPLNEILEIKCPWPGGNTLEEVREYGRDSPEFKKYYIQVQHQLLVAQAKKATLVFLDGDELIEFEITPDKAVQDKILVEGTRFWTCMQTRTPPNADPYRDRYELKDPTDIAEWESLAEEYIACEKVISELKEKLKPYENMQKELKSSFLQILDRRGANIVSHAGVSVNRSFSASSPDIDKLRQLIAYDKIEACRGTSSRTTVTVTKK